MSRPVLLPILVLLVTSTTARADDPTPAADAGSASPVSEQPAPPPAQPTQPAAPAPEPTPAPSTPAPAPAAPVAGLGTTPIMTGIPIRHGVSWDVEVALGLRIAHDSGDDSRWGYARARAGVLLFREPTFLSVGIAGQYGPLGSSALGLEAQVIDIQRGIWLQLGGFPIDSVGATVEAAFGFSLFGLEWQRRVSGSQSGDQALLVVLEVPLGVINVLRKPPPGLIIAPKTADAR